MSDYECILVTRTRETIRAYKGQEGWPDNMPNVGAAFADNADMRLVGEDGRFSVRFAVPADKKEEIKGAVREKGYIANNDFTLKAFTPVK